MTLIKHKTFYNKKKTYLLFWQLSSIQLKVSLSWIIVVNALKILSEVAEECNKEKGSCMNNKCHLFYKNNIIPEQSLIMFKMEIRNNSSWV